MRKLLIQSLFFSLFLFFFLITVIAQGPNENQEDHGNLKFIENINQWDDRVEFKANIYGGVLFLEKTTFTYLFYDVEDFKKHSHHEHSKNINDDEVVDCHAYKVEILGADPNPDISGKDMLSEYHNYYIGNDKSKWSSNAKLYREISYTNILPSVNLNVYSKGSNLKYDFIVASAGDANSIKMQYTGVDSLYLSGENLNIVTSVNKIIEQKPYAYQVIDGEEKSVPCEFSLTNSTIGFLFPEGYDDRYQLIIDPVLVFSTYSGSTSAEVLGFTATYDSLGNLYSAGRCTWSGYPTTVGAYKTNISGSWDIAISKYNPTGTALLYATYLGGSLKERPHSLIVNDNNELVVFGTTESTDFPTTVGAYDSVYDDSTDIIVSRFNSTGSTLQASTYLGGGGRDAFHQDGTYNYGDAYRGELMTDSNNNCYVAAYTESNDFPTTIGALQTSLNGGRDGFIVKMDYNLNNLIWGTFLGGSDSEVIFSLILDDSLNIYVTGGTESADFPFTPGAIHTSFQGGSHDGFVTKIAPDGSAILKSSFIGTNEYDQSFKVQLDRNKNVYLFGQTEGVYPVVNANYSNPNSGQFVTKLNNSLNTVIFSTVFGNGSGDPNIVPTAFQVDDCERLYFCGFTEIKSLSNNMPITSDAYKDTTDFEDFYFMVLEENAHALLYGTYFGGNENEHVDGGTCRFDKKGVVYHAVCSRSFDFPTSPGAYSTTKKVMSLFDICSFKFELDMPGISASITPVDTGCVPYTTTFNYDGVGGSKFYWDFGDGDTSSAPSPVHTYTSQGNYLVRLIAQNVACNIFDTAYTTVIVDSAGVSANISPVLPADSGCAPFTATFNNTSTGGSVYYWDFGDGDTSSDFSPVHVFDSTGNFQVQLIAKNSGCNISDTTTTTVNVYSRMVSAIIDSITPADSGCAPFTATFNNGSIGGSKYYWDFGDGDTSSTFSPTHTFTSTGTYPVQLIIWNDECNIYDTTYTNIIASPLTLGLDQDTTICQNDSVELKALANSTSYLWSTGDTTETISVFNSGAYIVTVTKNGCSGSDTINVSLNSLPAVDAGDDIKVGCEPAQLEAKSNSAISYMWKPETGLNIPYISNPMVLPPKTTYYKVTVTDDNNCTFTDSVLVSVDFISSLDIPNAFTPNGDGVNDVIKVVSRCIVEFELKVFNRFGNLVFQTNDITQGWDGTKKGKPLPAETYVYYLTAKSYLDEIYTKQGHIFLIR